MLFLQLLANVMYNFNKSAFPFCFTGLNVSCWLCLFSVETLRCLECVPGLSRTCTNKTKECPLGGQQCAAMRVFIYGGVLFYLSSSDSFVFLLLAQYTLSLVAGGSKFADFSVKTCALVEECVEGSVNFGDARTVITSKCCTSDLCNTQPAPGKLYNTGIWVSHCSLVIILNKTNVIVLMLWSR